MDKIYGRVVVLTVFLTTIFATAMAMRLPTPAIGVLAITGNVEGINEECAEAIGTNLGMMKSVVPVERLKLPQVYSEQMLQDEGIVQGLLEGIAQGTGADYVLIGNVNVQRSDFGSSSSYGGKTKERTVTLNLRLVDARESVGNVVWSAQDTSTCLSDDATAAADEAVYDCMRQLYNFFPVKGFILKLTGDQCYLDIGANDGVRKGDKMIAQGAVEKLQHPLTGEEIVISHAAAKMKVVEVHEDYSIAEIDGDITGTLAPGNIVTRELHGKPRNWIGLWSKKVAF